MTLGFRTQRFTFDGATKTWDSPLPGWDSPRTLVTIFGSPDLESISEGLDQVRQRFGKSVIVGCSTSGEIHGQQVRDESLSVGVARFESTKLRQVAVDVTDADQSFGAGESLANQLAGPALRAIFVLSDGLNVNGSELVAGINACIADGVVVTGGLAGDGPRFENTWVATKNELGSQMVAAVGFYGDKLQVHHASRGGWDNFGPQRTVTRSEGNVLWELDGEPALALYERYLGDRAKDLPSSGLRFPLAIQAPGEDRVLVRTLLAIDRDEGSMTFAGDIPQGSKAQLMKAQLSNLVDGAEDAAHAAFADIDDDPPAGLAIAVSCVGRRLVLGDRTEDELDAIGSVVDGPDSSVVGFYSYGELSPVEHGECSLHNQTMTLTIFSEQKASAADLRSRLRGALKKVETGTMELTGEALEEARRAAEDLGAPKPLQVGATVYDLKSKVWSSQLPDLDSPQTLVLAFGSPQARDATDIFETLSQTYPNSHIMGCSSSGEIAGTEVLDESISVAVTKFATTQLQRTSTDVASADDSFSAGQTIANDLLREDLKAVFILSEGLNVNGTELVRGVNAVVAEDVVVTGGLAGDEARFEKTWILADGAVKSNAVTAVGFYGDQVQVTHGSQGGWDKFGPQRTVTRSAGNVLYEIDGRPALALYKVYLGDKADDLPAAGLRFPIALLDADDESRNVVRTLLSVDHEDQSLTFAGDVPEGAKIQLMKAHFDRLIDGAEDAAALAEPADSSTNSLAIAVSCVGRRLVLGDRTEDELDAVSRRLGDGATLTGFYSYGELSPVAGGRCDLHNQTMTLTVISEKRVTDQEYVTAVDFETTRAGTANSFATARCHYSLDDESWEPQLPSQMDSPQTLVMAFGAPEAGEKRDGFKDLAASFPKSQIIGCSGAGEIAGTHVEDRSLSVAIIRFSKTLLNTALVDVASADDSYAAGQQLAKELKTDQLRAIFILSEGLGVNGTDLVRGVNAEVGAEVVVTGGLAGDGSDFEKTWIYGNGQVRANAVVAVGFYGDHFRITHGSQGGWDNFGPERTVTRSDGNVLYELDNTPALSLYKTYLGAKADELPASGLRFPLSIIDAGDGEKRHVVRTLLSVDHDAESLTFAGDIPEGARVQLMKANFDRLIGGAEAAASMTSLDEINDNALAIAVSCVGRRLVLGARTEDELEAVADRLPEKATLAGFYSYGELSPTTEGTCDLHNQTMTLTVFGESKKARAKTNKPPTPARKKPSIPGPSKSSRPAKSAKSAKSSPKAPPKVPVGRAEVLPTDSTATELLDPDAKAGGEDRAAEDWVRPVIPVRRSKIQGGPIAVESSENAGVMTYRLLGKLDEKFNGAALGRKLRGIVVLDLAEVHRVTSFGVREWLAMLGESDKVDELYLVRCSESIANQLATIRAFAGSSRVVSFFAPYLCEHCGTSFNALLDVEFDRADLRVNRPPTVTCLNCHQDTAALDEDPRTFFSFAEKDFSVPGFVRNQLGNLPELRTAEPVEKVINESGTFIRVNTALDDSIRWRRLLDGVEGKVIVDFSGVRDETAAGISAFVQNASRHAEEAQFVFPEVSAALLQQLYDANLGATYQRVNVPGQCSDGKAVVATVDIPSNRGVIDRGGEPRATCQECSGTVDVSQSMELLKFAAGIITLTASQIRAANEASSDAAAEPSAGDPRASEPPAVEARSKSPDATMTRAVDDEGAANSDSAQQRYIQIGIIAVLVVVLAAVLLTRDDEAQQASGEEATAVAAVDDGDAADDSAASDNDQTTDNGSDESGQAAAAASNEDDSADDDSDSADDEEVANDQWSTDDGVRPAWSDQVISSDGDQLLIVGRAVAATRDDVLDVAHDDAIVALIDHLRSQLRGQEVYEVINGDSPAPEEMQVATFERQMSSQLSINRQDQAFRGQDDQVEAVVQFAVARSAVEAAEQVYTEVLSTESADFAQRFPSVAGPPEHDVMIVSSRSSRLEPGNVVLSEDESSIYTLDQLRRRAEDTSFLRLVVDANGVAKPVNIPGLR